MKRTPDASEAIPTQEQPLNAPVENGELLPQPKKEEIENEEKTDVHDAYKESGINVINGDAIKKERVAERYRRNFEEKIGQEKFGNGREKSPAAKELIVFLTKEVPEFAREYGATPIRLREEHIRFIPSEIFDPFGKTINAIAFEGESYEAGHYDIRFQEIDIRYDGPMVLTHLARVLIHEILHFQSFQSLVVNRPGDWTGTGRRIGFGTGTRSGEHYFAEIDEAVIDELSDRFMQRIASGAIEHELLQKFLQQEKVAIERMSAQPEWRQQIKEEMMRPISKQIGKSALKNIREEDLIHRFALQNISGKGYAAVSTTYPGERLNLLGLTREIFAKNKNRFASEEEVFTLFAKASMSGNYLELARMYEKTFGKGSFRRLGKKTKLKRRVPPSGGKN